MALGLGFVLNLVVVENLPTFWECAPYEANTERTLRVFSVKAEGVSSNTALEEGEWSKDHCMEGLDLKDSRIILFTLDVPKSIEIECSSVTINQEPNKIEFVEPWLRNVHEITSSFYSRNQIDN